MTAELAYAPLLTAWENMRMNGYRLSLRRRWVWSRAEANAIYYRHSWRSADNQSEGRKRIHA